MPELNVPNYAMLNGKLFKRCYWPQTAAHAKVKYPRANPLIGNLIHEDIYSLLELSYE